MADSAAKSAKTRGKPFKKGYDKRRWLSGRGIKSPEQKEGEKILLAVIWEELSREYDTRTKTVIDDAEIVDTMRLMVRQWIKRSPDKIAERIAGKVTERIDLGGNVKLTWRDFIETDKDDITGTDSE